MKISCTQENLNQGLTIVSHIASKNTALPILNNILIKASDNLIKLSATNLEIGVSCFIRGKVETEGEFTVTSRLISDYVNSLPKDRVDLITPNSDENNTDQSIDIKCKNNSTKIKGQIATDFPFIPEIEKKNSYTVDVQEFKQALSQVIFAVAISETRPEISGVLFNFKKDKLTIVATDSYRLAEKVIKVKTQDNKPEQQIIVPSRTLQELQRILGSFKDPAAISDINSIEIFISDNQILFTTGEVDLISRLIEGQYPDYGQIIPQRSDTKTVLDTTDLIKATKTASLFAKSDIYDVSLEFNSSENEIIVSSVNNQLGENTTKVSGVITGESGSVVVNFRYLLDGLQNIDSDQVEISITDSGSPCVIKPVSKNEDYLYIVMPIKQ